MSHVEGFKVEWKKLQFKFNGRTYVIMEILSPNKHGGYSNKSMKCMTNRCQSRN